eukprot:CAMPEP_0115372834 /NCGR_PEP_ID=MMETSP0271-20121206/1110_1 /TAXON_ID=71861 /ORGANISM="Scrippsiella trochoidea, Strain CCMP3099" /LENGTH=62 /DNA_ID=CAMNT_0002795797 /DNA_START=573 /DNA_END=761 /DNA_ORIENTATION=-
MAQPLRRRKLSGSLAHSALYAQGIRGGRQSRRVSRHHGWPAKTLTDDKAHCLAMGLLAPHLG